MLVEKNIKNKRKSWYICDKCGEKLTGISRHLLSIDGVKEADLCRNCIKVVKRFCKKEV